MKKLSRGKIILLSAAFVVLAGVIITVIIMMNNKSENVKEQKVLYRFTQCISNQFNPMSAGNLSMNNGLFYINCNGIWEYDDESGKTIQLPSTINPLYSMQPYNGQLFGISYNSQDMESDATLSLADMNSGKKETLYNHTKDMGMIGNALIADTGDIFFIEGNTSERQYDDNGYIINKCLYSFNSQTKEKKLLVEGINNYYIYKERIYFDRENKDNFIRLFYADINDTSKITDTKINVNNSLSAQWYQWLPADDGVYYCQSDNKIYKADIDSGKTEVYLEKGEDESILFFDFFKENIVCQCVKDLSDGVQRTLEMYNTEEKEWSTIYSGAEELANDNASTDTEPATINGFYVFEGLDYFVLEERQINSTGRRYSKCFADGKTELFAQPQWEK